MQVCFWEQIVPQVMKGLKDELDYAKKAMEDVAWLILNHGAQV